MVLLVGMLYSLRCYSCGVLFPLGAEDEAVHNVRGSSKALSSPPGGAGLLPILSKR